MFEKAGNLLVKGEGGWKVRNWGYPMFMLCPDNPYTIMYWESVMQYLFGELRLDGILLDQAGGGFHAPYCFNPAHNHTDHDCYGQGMLKLLDGIRQKIRSIQPEAFIFGELAHDFRTRYVDFWLWHWFFGGLEDCRGYGETLVWMKYIRPDAIFVEWEPKICSPEPQAAKVAGRGVWLNAHMPGQDDDGWNPIQSGRGAKGRVKFPGADPADHRHPVDALLLLKLT